MEAILIEMESLAPLGFSIAGLILLSLATAAICFGYAADEEKRGKRLYWAEWPFNETEEKAETPFEEEYLKAA